MVIMADSLDLPIDITATMTDLQVVSSMLPTA